MTPPKLVRDLRDLYRGFVELLVLEDEGEDASYRIAASAQRFSRNAQAAVDDKLNFSATLMRAGEVEAARRLLKEFHDDVREEEVALIEQVNEVKAAEAVRRAGMTRVRFARMLAVALVGSSALSFSAAGMALAGLMRDRAAADQAAFAAAEASEDRVLGTRLAARAFDDGRLRRVNIGRVQLMLSRSEIRTIRELAGGQVDETGLHDLISLLPDQLAAKVQEAFVAASDAIEQAKESVKVVDVAAELRAQRRKARKAEAKAEEKAESTPQPSPSDNNEQRSEDDDDGGLTGDEDDSSNEGEEDDTSDEEESDEDDKEEDGNLPTLFDGD